MKTLMKILLLVIIVALCYWGFLSSNYPESWNKFHLGQKRDSVHLISGKPTAGELWEYKGDIYIENYFLS